MKSRTSYLLNTLPTVVMVIIVISTTIFWLRFFCISYRRILLPSRSLRVELTPSGLVDDLELIPMPQDAEPASKNSNLYKLRDGTVVRKYRSNMLHNPDVASLSNLTFGVHYDIYSESLGSTEAFEQLDYHGSFEQSISDDIYFIQRQYEQFQDQDTGFWREVPTNLWHVVYFDTKLGLIVNCDINFNWNKALNKGKWKKVIHSYAGPEGISENPEKTIGRFTNLLRHSGPWRRVVFDRTRRRFFNIDFKEQKVTKGQRLDLMPAQFGTVEKNTSKSYISFDRPYRPLTENELADETLPKLNLKRIKKGSQEIECIPVRRDMRLSYYRKDIVVLDQNYGLCMLDPNSLKFSLPVSLLPNLDCASPDNLFAYSVVPFNIGDKCDNLVVGAVGAELYPSVRVTGTAARNNKIPKWDLWSSIGGWPALAISKFILESFQPVVFNIAAFQFATKFDAAEDPRSLFIQPDSAMGMIARSPELDDEGLGRFFLVVASIAPALFISIFLAGWVARDAKRIGLTKTARSLWTIGTLGFGLSALVAYILTKPAQTLVTCKNCGALRRPDMDLCHQCHAKWKIPDLAPPAWRVLD